MVPSGIVFGAPCTVMTVGFDGDGGAPPAAVRLPEHPDSRSTNTPAAAMARVMTVLWMCDVCTQVTGFKTLWDESRSSLAICFPAESIEDYRISQPVSG